MKQTIYGLLLLLFLILPPVADLLESIMYIHMHMQMPLLVVSGFLMARFFQNQFPQFFAKWNSNGIPGIILFVIITSYWMLIPRLMDEAITMPMIEGFKFVSLPFLAGVPLRDSWKKLSSDGKNIVYEAFVILLFLVAWIYIGAKDQLCNNYLIHEQKELGWGTLVVAVCITIYLIQLLFTDQSEYEEAKSNQSK